MLIASLTRMSLGKPGWSYREFDDLDHLADWALGNPEAAQGIQHVTEFRGGLPVKVPAEEWCNAIQIARSESRSWEKHLKMARVP